MQVVRLPPAPQIYGRVTASIREGKSTVSDIADLLKLDASLVSQILKFANAAMFGFRSPALDLDEAILRVGSREIQRIVALASASLVYREDLVVYGFSAELMWRNSVASALAMETLANRAGGDPGSAYSAGLLRNVGKVVLARHAASLKGFAPFVPGETSLPAWERANFGVTNAHVAAGLCEAWRLPIEITRTVRDHLDPQANEFCTPLAHLLNLTGQIASELRCGLKGEETLWGEYPGRASLPPVVLDDLPAITEDVGIALKSAQELLKLHSG